MNELDYKLDCNGVRSVIDDLMTSELPESVVLHTSSCLECRDYAAKTIRLREVVRDSHRVTAPDDFDSRLRERLQIHTNRSKRFWAYIPTPALAAAATFVVTAAITFGVLKHMHGNSDEIASSNSPVTASQGEMAKNNLETPATPANNNASVIPVPVNHPVGTTPVAYTGHQSPKSSRINSETAANVPGVTILLRDGQRDEQVMHVPQVIVGARSVVPRGSSGKRPQYEPSVF